MRLDQQQVRHLAIAATLVAAGAVVLFSVEPSRFFFVPPCLFHEWTGLHCPLCGATRAMHHLLHGHVLMALHCNLLAVLGVPFAAGLGYRALTQRQGHRSFLQAHPWATPLLVAILLVFGVLRNIPAGPFPLLAPVAETQTPPTVQVVCR